MTDGEGTICRSVAEQRRSVSLGPVVESLELSRSPACGCRGALWDVNPIETAIRRLPAFYDIAEWSQVTPPGLFFIPNHLKIT